jgi:hypothetical protein
MHAKTIPNAVTVATGKISHTGTSSFLPELKFMQSILPKDQWKVRMSKIKGKRLRSGQVGPWLTLIQNIKLTITSPSW